MYSQSINCSECKHDAGNQAGDKLVGRDEDGFKLAFTGAITTSEGFFRQANSRSHTMTIAVACADLEFHM